MSFNCNNLIWIQYSFSEIRRKQKVQLKPRIQEIIVRWRGTVADSYAHVFIKKTAE